MFKNAIVRKPSMSMVNGLTTATLGLPDHDLAIQQHKDYVKALQSCGVQVHVLEALEAFPDSTFVEDVALLTPTCAIITNPGAESRRGESEHIIDAIRVFYSDIQLIQSPGTIEAGDIMMVGDHYYIGLSQRTNAKGAQQLIEILNDHGYSGSTVALKEMLHLKTGLAYLEHNHLLVYGEFVENPLFEQFNRLEIPTEESYAANAIWVNDRVLLPNGYPKSKQLIQQAGYAVIEVEVSEFKKLDGGLSCLSLRF